MEAAHWPPSEAAWAARRPPIFKMAATSSKQRMITFLLIFGLIPIAQTLYISPRKKTDEKLPGHPGELKVIPLLLVAKSINIAS